MARVIAAHAQGGVAGCCLQLTALRDVLFRGAEQTGATPKAAREAAGAVCRPWLAFEPGLDEAQAELTAGALAEAVEEVVAKVQPWESGGFTFVKHLEDAKRNFGQVDFMTREAEGVDASGDGAEKRRQDVAVKKMPKRWIGLGPKDFGERHPDAFELPWVDIGILKWLNDLRFPFVCSLHGVFEDAISMYVVSSLATNGDLFSWTFGLPGVGREREAMIRPLVAQALYAVGWLHELGIGHRDLSLENLLLEEVDGGLRVKVIDFAMATRLRPCSGHVGKRSYQAPEMHYCQRYDPFAADAFALGVTLFTMAVKNYPWSSTRWQQCVLFEHVVTHGFKKYMETRKLRKGEDLRLSEAFSPEFNELIVGLLELKPEHRMSLGEACFDRGPKWKRKRSVWDLAWWNEKSLDSEDGAEAEIVASEQESVEVVATTSETTAAAAALVAVPQTTAAPVSVPVTDKVIKCHGSRGIRLRRRRPGRRSDF
mmetsp:Transcript_30929/g.103083  ORF Transcript_30929/g.103083 Transcript_30929/m.103083 type:complete len:483 (-) Transcript_30929:153-1601(-)